MRVLGIIVEYNPFHNGHSYQIESLRRETGADYAIVAMNGNFTQRGAPALMEKYHRARAALCCGADLVLELPAIFGTSSAEYFARGGVSLLNATGVVTHLGFGTEDCPFGILAAAAGAISREPDIYRETLRQGQKEGLSFPAARLKALRAYFSANGMPADGPFGEALSQALSSPNNILAVEYLKAISAEAPGIIPVPLARRGGDHHDESLSGKYCSASAIRSLLLTGGRAGLPALSKCMPPASLSILEQYPYPYLREDDFSMLLRYKLSFESAEWLASCADGSPELAARIKKKLPAFTTWTGFLKLLKTKNVTYARLSRFCLHALLGIRKEDYDTLRRPAYLRVLGLRKAASPLLAAIRSRGSLPLVTSSADAMRSLPEAGKRELTIDLNAGELYRIGLGGEAPLNDFRHPIVCL